MIRTCAALAACMWVLAGCAQMSSRQTFAKHYTLAGPAMHSQPASRTPPRNATLQVASIDAPPWLQGTGLYYRLAYRHDDRIATYAQSDWVSPPAHLLEQRIQNTIADDGGWRAVTGPANPAHADFSLHVRLDDFSQIFDGPRQSHGALDATVTLVDNHSGEAIAQKHFRVTAAAPSPDAEGGVKALNEAASQFTMELERWLRAVPAAGSESRRLGFSPRGRWASRRLSQATFPRTRGSLHLVIPGLREAQNPESAFTYIAKSGLRVPAPLALAPERRIEGAFRKLG